MKKRNFTLVELLVVIGILAILASLIIPAVIGAKQQGRITQARADMSSLRTAFESMAKDYNGRMAKKDSSGYNLGGESLTTSSSGYAEVKTPSGSNKVCDEYCRAIAELADPGNSYFNGTGVKDKLLNKRKIKYLDPRPEYDPSKSPTYKSSDGKIDNPENTWLDPWGNQYRIRIDVDGTETIVDPSDTSKKLSGRIILWSLGPDGAGGSDETNKDNIPSWKDGNWFD